MAYNSGGFDNDLRDYYNRRQSFDSDDDNGDDGYISPSPQFLAQPSRASLDVQNARDGYVYLPSLTGSPALQHASIIPAALSPLAPRRSLEINPRQTGYRQTLARVRRQIRKQPAAFMVLGGLGIGLLGLLVYRLLKYRSLCLRDINAAGAFPTDDKQATSIVKAWSAADLANILTSKNVDVIALLVKSKTCGACPDTEKTFKNVLCFYAHKLTPNFAAGTLESDELRSSSALRNISAAIESTPTLIILNRSSATGEWEFGQSFAGKPTFFETFRFRGIVANAVRSAKNQHQSVLGLQQTAAAPTTTAAVPSANIAPAAATLQPVAVPTPIVNHFSSIL